MVRHYKRKTISKYSEADIQKALEAIRNENLKPCDVACDRNIPLSTLYARLAGKHGHAKRGGHTIFSTEEEEFLVHTVEIFEKWQLPLLRKSLIDIARSYMLELGKKISRTAPLLDWFSGFMTRHPELKVTQSMKLEKVRSVSCNPQAIQGWFKNLHDVLVKYKLLDRPNAIFNVDECGFLDDPGRLCVIVKRSTKYPIASHSGTGKNLTTVLVCSSANGKILPPYIIFQGAHLWSSWISKNCFPGTRFNASLSGWVEEQIFFDWLRYHFIPYVKDIPKPVLLILDGHNAHISTRISKIAIDGRKPKPLTKPTFVTFDDEDASNDTNANMMPMISCHSNVPYIPPQMPYSTQMPAPYGYNQSLNAFYSYAQSSITCCRCNQEILNGSYTKCTTCIKVCCANCSQLFYGLSTSNFTCEQCFLQSSLDLTATIRN
ncbi:unnamed protein product [Rotaria socialis]|uniref:DDE-1 domain-containing protein n=1 Tax=Rotaria socialis TaxID=392032 RepID=A0A818PJ59_9BILA|nr:unnamed protein product [Rotaria socialis]CAF3624278.1 unnamed protein product [Rotaria socialis]CAF4580996.1 unnamed protein product [Rotaria socialis]CAF4634750.1 unnamed protein product [Rotaria socialis]CAF4681614.1 unnamed protein product [Rotaria socialis]